MSNPGFRRVAPAIGLFFVAPLVAEFLLGDLPIKLLGVIAILAPLYGGGALLIREVVRRTGRGWPSIFVLAFAYAVFEEAFTTQTLFNPNYLNLNLHLLQPAYIPALGIGIWWTVFVLTLHTVWSISVSIALGRSAGPGPCHNAVAESSRLDGDQYFVRAGRHRDHRTPDQDFALRGIDGCSSAVAAVVCLVAIVAGFLLPARSAARGPGSVPNPWLIGAAALVAGSIFLIVPGDLGMDGGCDLPASGSDDDCGNVTPCPIGRDGMPRIDWHSLAEPPWPTRGTLSFNLLRSAVPG